MITLTQRRFMTNLKRIFKVKVTISKVGKVLGYATVIKNQAHIQLYDSLKKSTGELTSISRTLRDIVEVHEYGHIYYDHIFVDQKTHFDEIQDLYKKYHPDGSYLTPKWIHDIINICMDIEVNSKLLEQSQLDEMKNNGFELCTPEYYGVQPKLPYTDYFEDVIKTLNYQISDGTANINVDPDVIMPVSDIHGDGNGNQSMNGSGDGDLDSDQDDSGDKDGKDKSNKDGDRDEKESGNSDDESRTYDPNLADPQEELEGNGGGGYGAGHGSLRQTSYIMSSEERQTQQLKDLLKDMSTIDFKYEVGSDSLRIYNRKSRGKSNLLPTSLRQRYTIHKDKPKIIIQIDTSGSMEWDVLRRMMRIIMDSKKDFHKESVIINWTTHLNQVIPLKEKDIKLTCGGGTHMASGLEYIAENYDLQNQVILLVTDFEDQLDEIESTIKKYDLKVYFVNWGDIKNEDLKNEMPSLKEGVQFR